MKESMGTAITLAPLGGKWTKKEIPHLPTSIDELVHDAVGCEAAGASILHLHIRDRDGASTMDPDRAIEVIAALRASTSLVLEISTGGSLTESDDARIQMVDVGADAASVACGSVNIGGGVFLNTWDFISKLYRQVQRRGIVPIFEILDLGHVGVLHKLLDDHGPPPTGHVHCELILGLDGGMAASPEVLLTAIASLPEGATFSVSGVRSSIAMALAGLGSGGHLRIGLEDTVELDVQGNILNNIQLTERAAALAVAAERPPLDPASARRFIGLSHVGDAKPRE